MPRVTVIVPKNIDRPIIRVCAYDGIDISIDNRMGPPVAKEGSFYNKAYHLTIHLF
jgi:hypothetical protein